jgi:hypothetical protein
MWNIDKFLIILFANVDALFPSGSLVFVVISNGYGLAKSRVSAFMIERFSIDCYIFPLRSERADSVKMAGKKIYNQSKRRFTMTLTLNSYSMVKAKTNRTTG